MQIKNAKRKKNPIEQSHPNHSRQSLQLYLALGKFSLSARGGVLFVSFQTGWSIMRAVSF
jgi:hypothetical protein